MSLLSYILVLVPVAFGAALQSPPGGAAPSAPLHLQNVLPGLDAADHIVRDPKNAPPRTLPIAVPPFDAQVRGKAIPFPPGNPLGLAFDTKGTLYAATSADVYSLGDGDTWTKSKDLPQELALTNSGGVLGTLAWQRLFGQNPSVSNAPDHITASALKDETLWLGTEHGLARISGFPANSSLEYVSDATPYLSQITAVAVDSRDALWVGTPFGLLQRARGTHFVCIRGRDGLPYEDIASIAIDAQDRLWIGTTSGLIQYRPYEAGRHWFYRAGERYLIDDHVNAVAIAPDGRTVFAATPKGISRLNLVTTTLLERALTIERLVNERHRRLGLVAECTLDNAENPASHHIDDNDNDGLWTAYHVAAMSLCYGATKDPAAKRSAMESMHALYMLQNASGIPGVVARSVVPPDIGVTKDADRPEPKRQWRKTPDGTLYWKSDTSSDEIDGHYLAFYTYFAHIAKDDPEERDTIVKQVRAVTDYLIDNGYRLIDWNGERTRWGFWNPEALNDDPENYLENGLNSLQMLSFLRVAHYVTGESKYLEHYHRLIEHHGYLNNVLLSKKVWPDDNNHSDDQLGFVAWYPILQLEKDPAIGKALLGAVRRHYKVVAPEQPSFYTFVYATVDADHADIEGAIENLKQIPTDRRGWRMVNSHRADVNFAPYPNRFGKTQLTRVLPADERDFGKWNGDPYEPDRGDGGAHEDDGAAYLLPYWMGRYHGFVAEAK